MEAERRVEPWAVAVVLALATLVGIPLSFWGVAALHPDAPVVADAYAVGLRYNAEQRALEEARRQGWGLSLDAERDPGGVRVAIRVVTPEGVDPRDVRVTVRRERPAQTGFDRVFPLAWVGEAYTGHIPLPLVGRWRLVARTTHGSTVFERVFALESAP